MNGRRTKRNRQRVAIERRVEPYLVELRRSKVPPLTVKAAKAVMLILLRAGRTG